MNFRPSKVRADHPRMRSFRRRIEESFMILIDKDLELGSLPSGRKNLNRLVDEYTKRKRFDDADLKRGQKHIPDKNSKRNPLVDGDLDVEVKPVKVRYVG